jgi:hypothetical protein
MSPMEPAAQCGSNHRLDAQFGTNSNSNSIIVSKSIDATRHRMSRLPSTIDHRLSREPSTIEIERALAQSCVWSIAHPSNSTGSSIRFEWLYRDSFLSSQEPSWLKIECPNPSPRSQQRLPMLKNSNPIPVRMIVLTPSDSIPLRNSRPGRSPTLQKKRQSAKHLPFPLKYQPLSPSSMEDAMA